MTHLEVESSFIEEIGKNTFMRQKCNEFTKAVEEGKSTEFFDNNPDFLQMMMHMAQDERIKLIGEPIPDKPYDIKE